MSPTKDNFGEWLNQIKTELKKLKAAMANHGWTLENMQNSVEEATKLRRGTNGKGTRKTGRPSRPRTAAARRSNSRYVQEGVTRVIIEHDADGFMHAHIENIGLAVDLKTSQRLRQVLLVLCGKVSRVNDPDSGLVPYKTSAELREAIEEISGKRISITNLQNQIHLLRDRFQLARIDPSLIETGGGGYRFRLQLDGDFHEEI